MDAPYSSPTQPSPAQPSPALPARWSRMRPSESRVRWLAMGPSAPIVVAAVTVGTGWMRKLVAAELATRPVVKMGAVPLLVVSVGEARAAGVGHRDSILERGRGAGGVGRDGEVERVDARGVVREGGSCVVAAVGQEAEGAAAVVAAMVAQFVICGNGAERLGDAPEGLRAIGSDTPDALESLDDKGGAAERHATGGPCAGVLREGPGTNARRFTDICASKTPRCDVPGGFPSYHIRLKPEERGSVEKLAILILSEANGATVREVNPPAQ